ncbi:3-hydroxyisobutyrate dehydrogenase protein [Apiospora kogelbergensis]|uniref:3-hydroxyisobutyrate dehydrogenase protein n=1 Tax=Apiospora kogelbergensis TaxID=1337665 RepID=UPI00312FB509
MKVQDPIEQLLIPQSVGGTPENGGKYEPVRAYDRQYAKVARNRKEGRHQTLKSSSDAELDDPESSPLIPRDPEDIEMAAVTPYTSTTSLVPAVPRTHDDVETTALAQDSSSDSGQAPGWTVTTLHSTTTSLASTFRGSSTTEGKDIDGDDLLERSFAPSHLCFLEYDKNAEPIAYETRKVTDWVREHKGDHSGADYVFLSYTRAQFNVFTEEGLDEMGVEDPEARKTLLHIAAFDRATLERHGIDAAHQAGKKAFWWDFECIKNPDGSAATTVNNPEVYGICDIARAAHSMVVLVGPSVESKKSRPLRAYSEEALAQWLDEGAKAYSQETMTEWMQDWGSRLWTLPEILLISPEEPVKVFAIGGPRPPEKWAKRNFASRPVWKDAKLVRQLIDHYESSIHLEPLELLSLAMECFFHRVAGKRFEGDKAYALMGLLRRRPMVNTEDSEFTAFARLSLANDSESLLERLICLQPLEVDKPWHDQRDFWDSKLWDIEPKCQIAGIADDETVVLDGAYGATIEWSTMKPVYFFTRPTFRRTLTKWTLRGSPYYLIAAIALVYFSASTISQINQFRADIQADRSAKGQPPVAEADLPSADTFVGLLVLFVFLLISALGLSLAAPAMILNLYVGKFWNTQASFVGMEGVPAKLGLVEEYLFAADRGRLKWSAAGSTLSRHKESEDYKGDCIGLPPLVFDNTGYYSEGSHLRAFTIIDTYSMTAMAFRAARPPTAVIVCGQEGGMQRAALCSYDWKRNTFSREQVVRLKTAVLDRMFRMDRFRFSFKRRAVSQEAAKTAWPAS